MAVCFCSIDKWTGMAVADIRVIEEVRGWTHRRGAWPLLAVLARHHPSTLRRALHHLPPPHAALCSGRR